jgi:iron complex outermembrane recepter protein
MYVLISKQRNHFTIIGSKFLRRLVLAASLGPLLGFAQQPADDDISQASLEDLMNLQVTSVSKKEEKLSKAGAAVFVITQEDIRRSGATNIPDVLRLAPGVVVARVDANRWAISVRGFSDDFADKVLVLIDGRSVFSPSFSGVFWDMQNVPLEDIERIEVIRGPGGTVWGANAVNGVINIITKNSKTTQGGLISAGAGSQVHADGLVQYGGAIGQNGTYRVYGRYFDVGNTVFPNGEKAADAWSAGQAGFRSDWDLSPRDSLTVQGDFLKTDESQTVTELFLNALPLMGSVIDPVKATGGNILARWNHTLANGSEMTLQAYDDYSRHLDRGFLNAENTVDLDFQHHVALGSRNDVVWGLGTRLIDSNYGSGYYTILPSHRFDHLFTAFLQDEVKITKSLSLTIGSKVEHNDFTGFEYDPSAQLVWAPTKKQAVWLSIARALQEPNALAVGFQSDFASIPDGSTFAVLRIVGNPNLKPEELRDVEAGYRAQLNKRLSLDMTAFAGLYRDLEILAPQAPISASQQGTPYLVLPEIFANGASARTYGVEFSGTWNATRRWRISPEYSFFREDPSGDVADLQEPANASPRHQFLVRSFLDLPHHLEWDNTFGYVSGLTYATIPSHTRMDTRLGWRIGEFVELSVVGQNLFTPGHIEFQSFYGTNETLAQRSVFAKVTWRF